MVFALHQSFCCSISHESESAWPFLCKPTPSSTFSNAQSGPSRLYYIRGARLPHPYASAMRLIRWLLLSRLRLRPWCVPLAPFCGICSPLTSAVTVAGALQSSADTRFTCLCKPTMYCHVTGCPDGCAAFSVLRTLYGLVHRCSYR